MSSTTDQRAIQFESFELDPETLELSKAGVDVAVSGKSLDALLVLLKRSGEVVSSGELVESLWGVDAPDNAPDDLELVIKRLRGSLNDHERHPRFVETVPGTGYRFLPEVAGAENIPEPSPPGRTSALPRWAIPAAVFLFLVAVWAFRDAAAKALN